jgi:hypothetical protein
MIYAKLTGINRGELLRYLGYRGGELPPELLADIAECEAAVMQTAQPRAVWRVFDLAPDRSFAGDAFSPKGKDIRGLLQPCCKAILMAATLGAEVESLLRRAQARDMARAAIMDAAASAAVENVCDNLCVDLQAQFSPLCLTDRFSPGYGDFPLTQQAELCRVLDVSRRIGVFLSESGLMIPQKSVTALVGVADRPQEHRSRGCDICRLAGSCVYKKEGKYCEQA